MKVKYFRDTDTALFEFAERAVEETREIGENVIIDLDKDGNIVSMTIEHAARVASMPAFTLEEIGAGAT
jgi:uncharacterized protein YuzE